MAQTAREQYDALSRNIPRQLREVGERLKAHKSMMLTDPRNWGYAGDLGYVSEKLEELLAQFKPK